MRVKQGHFTVAFIRREVPLRLSMSWESWLIPE